MIKIHGKTSKKMLIKDVNLAFLKLKNNNGQIHVLLISLFFLFFLSFCNGKEGA